MVVFYAMNRDFTYVCLLAFVTVNAILFSYVTNSDRTIGALKPALPLSNSTDQMVTATECYIKSFRCH